MNRDRFIQMCCVGVALIALVASSLLATQINQQRRDLQLGFDVEIGDRVPPQVTIASQLGSFRGIAVNSLWYRAEMMKREGKYAEANTLANWIVILQPRYPHVWAFLAWNMAYNISVETYTPQERWDWVSKGISLLREKGIVYNPNSVRLYRELGWILFHKVGKFTDDINWYYKAEFAREWEEVLGAAGESRNPDFIMRAFLPVRNMADNYFSQDKANLRVTDKLQRLYQGNVIEKLNDRYPSVEEFEKFISLDITVIRERLRKIEPEVPADTAAKLQMEDLLQLVNDQIKRAERDPVAMLQQDFPNSKLFIDRLRQLDMPLDTTTLRAIGRCMMFLRLRPPLVVRDFPEEFMTEPAYKVLPLVVEAFGDRESALCIGAYDTLHFLRAQSLIEKYNMDPSVMFRYMATYGPLDWRHPGAHSLYWSQLGVERYFDLRDEDKVDILNTKRLAIHSNQLLTDAGTVSHNPLNPNEYAQIDVLPNPYFIDGYIKCINEAREMAGDKEFGRIKAESFNNGFENFLQKAVMFSWLYGSREKAAQYYQQLRDDYSDSAQNRSHWYELSLDDFVASLIFDDDQGRAGYLAIINSRLTEAFNKGLAHRRFEVFDRNLEIAAAGHAKYHEKYVHATGLDAKERMALPPLAEMAYNAFTQYILDQNVPLLYRINAYQTAYGMRASVPIVDQTYNRFIRSDSLLSELAAAGYQIDVAFPAPPQPDPDAQNTTIRAPLKPGAGGVERK